jgi:hypothetical protein
MSAFWIVLTSTLAGTVVASVLACLPGLHIYNVMGALVLGILALEGTAHAIPVDVYLPAFTAMVVGWSSSTRFRPCCWARRTSRPCSPCCPARST